MFNRQKTLREGQIWEYRDSSDFNWPNIPKVESLEDHLYHCNCSCEIIKVEMCCGMGGAFKSIKVKFLKEDHRGPYEVGDEADFTDDSFKTPHFRFLWEPTAVMVKQYGVYCGRCGDFYPHAERQMSFKCWGCRHGW